MLRQYLSDAYEMTLLTQLVDSAYRPLAEVAAKMRNEELYHFRHTSTWLKRLAWYHLLNMQKQARFAWRMPRLCFTHFLIRTV